MVDRPILFSAPMVRALLDGRKSQTRRILKPQPPRRMHYGKDIMDWGLSGIYQDDDNEGTNRWWLDVQTDVDNNSHTEFKVAAAVGDRLYVREHWRVSQKWDATAPRDLPARTMTVFFNAGGSIANQASGRWEPDNSYLHDRPDWVGKHRQAMHMPKWASRLTLIVTDVRVERLQDITETNAVAEGVDTERCCGVPSDSCGTHLGGCCGQPEAVDPVEAYQVLWDSINGPGAWDANPWVAAYTFTVHCQNIDQMEVRHVA